MLYQITEYYLRQRLVNSKEGYMLVNICVGKKGQKDFPEIAQVEIESMKEFLLDKKFQDIINKYILESNTKEKFKVGEISIKKTLFVENENNLFVLIG